MRLPQEILDEIITYLIHNIPALLSCSLTSYSWYIATVPHLHPNLLVFVDSLSKKARWPNPIRRMHRLGLLPFVKTVRIYGRPCFSSKWLNRRIIHQFSALINVHTLEISFLDISSFIPTIQRYFGPFFPTVRSLGLKSPRGSNREIIFFIGLFQHLKNLSLRSCWSQREPEDLTLIPLFRPPLDGRLVAVNSNGEGFFQDMLHLFGEMSFKALSLSNVGATRFLLRGCAKTLETVQLDPNDHLGER